MSQSYASHFSVDYIESLFQQYSQDPDSVEPSWRYFFEGMAFAGGEGAPSGAPAYDERVHNLIRGYRKWGHLNAKIDPLEQFTADASQLALRHFGFVDSDWEKQVPTCGFLDRPKAKLKDLVAALEKTYCGPIGVEYVEGASQETEKWFQERIEPNLNQPKLALEEKGWILKHLNEAELFEKFLHAKYVGQKRFSLEGGESFIPCMAALIDALAEHGADDVVIGMSHRGRLNLLANIMGKTYGDIFYEFEPNYAPNTVEGDGDVKYHKGYTAEYKTRSGKTVSLSLADNPSHLEAVCPVVQGLARAHQTLAHDNDRRRVAPVLVHGDASFSGQGIVSETLNMSQLEGYKTGGAIHIVINNQIGFTTSPADARSTRYCSDVARQILAPVFHVNGDHPEAIVHVVRLASAFRQTFHQDVVIDLVCYRRHGHNEGDEPSFTQPVMYRKIKKMKTVRQRYVAQLIEQGDLEAKVAKKLEREFKEKLQKQLDSARAGEVAPAKPEDKKMHRYRPVAIEEMLRPVDTAVDAERLRRAAELMTSLPKDFNPNPKIVRLMKDRRQQVEQGEAIDWGTGETLAYASLLLEDVPVRLSGQDVQRGTFSHRHGVVFDVESGEPYTPLNHLDKQQAHFSIYNSHLSELAVLGFEFGYSLARPKCLVVWEAQFGDFINGAQIIIDQFLASSESKWNRVSDLTLFLPHGYEGQGPEHSSARLERFLQLCADANMQVVNLTEPAQLFHALRRQVLRNFPKPLVVMAPKSLLRHKRCVSKLNDFSEGGFREIIPDPDGRPQAKRLLLCSGKVYYDLLEKRESLGAEQAAIARVEQLFPLAENQLADMIGALPELEELIWVQEEPENMGPWRYIEPRLRRLYGKPVRYVGREASASPAVGSMKTHLEEQNELTRQAFE